VVALHSGFTQDCCFDNQLTPRHRGRDCEQHWRPDGIHPRVVVKPRQRVLERVAFAELRERIEAVRDTKPVLGLGLGGQLVTADPDALNGYPGRSGRKTEDHHPTPIAPR
jgi:hypothetical protein